MTTHTYHEDSHTHGLADGCPRCEEHAEHPERNLDSRNLKRLMEGKLYTRLDQVAANRLRDIRKKAEYLEDVLHRTEAESIG